MKCHQVSPYVVKCHHVIFFHFTWKIFQFNMVTFHDMSWCGQSDSEGNNVNRWMLLMWMMKMKENVPTQQVKEARTASTAPCLISTSASSRWSRTVLHWIPSATRSIAVQSADASSPCSPRSSRTSRRTSRLTTDVLCAGKYSPEAGCLKDTWELIQVRDNWIHLGEKVPKNRDTVGIEEM